MTRPLIWSLASTLILLSGCASGTRSTSGFVADGSPEAAMAGMPTPRLAEGERVVRVVWITPGQHQDSTAATHRPVAPAAVHAAASTVVPAPIAAPAPTVREGERVVRVIRLPAGQRPHAVKPAPATVQPPVAPPATAKPQARVIRRTVCPPNLKSIFCPLPAGGCDDLCPGGQCGVPR